MVNQQYGRLYLRKPCHRGLLRIMASYSSTQFKPLTAEFEVNDELDTATVEEEVIMAPPWKCMSEGWSMR